MTVRPIEVDRGALLELARGANLYDDPFAPLRELLSNASDATLSRVFAEAGASAFPTHEGSLRDLRARLATHPIDVRIEAVGDRTSGHLEVCIRDHGTGISASDRRYLGLLGSSRKNPARRAMIEAMPEWMRPSGTFGIGLHAAFLLTSEVKLRSRHHASLEARTWVLRSDPLGVTLEEIEDAPLEGVGTEVSLRVPRRERARWGRWVVAGMDRARWEAFDPLFDAQPDHEWLAAVGGARMLGQGSAAPVLVNGEPVASAFDGSHACFDPATGVELAWVPGREVGGSWGATRQHDPFISYTFYRGAPVALRLDDEPVVLRANLHFGDARALLTLSRTNVRASAAAETRRRIRAALDAIGPRWMDPSDGFAAPEARWPSISRALFRHGVDEPREHWRRAPLLAGRDGGAPSLTLGELAQETSVDCIARPPFWGVSLPTRGELRCSLSTAREDLCRLFPHERILLRDPPHQRWGAEGGATVAATRQALRALRGPRTTIACPDGYRALAVDRPAVEQTWGSPRRERLLHLDAPTVKYLVLLPYVIRGGTLSVPEIATWLRFVAAHPLEGPRDAAGLAPTALRFLVDFDADVRALPGVRADYSLEGLREELETFGPLPSLDELRASLW